MGKTYDHIPPNIIKFIEKQEIFWVATAPLSGEGHVNVSPKGVRGTFHVEGPNKVWYDDLSGSGCETMAHLRENGRITFLFNAFEGSAMILRLYGRGLVYEHGTPEYDALLPESQRLPGSRAAVVAEIDRVGTSCGWGVPFYIFKGHRRVMLDFFKGLEKNDGAVSSDLADPDHANQAVLNPEMSVRTFWKMYNQHSIDDLPAFTVHDGKPPSKYSMPDPVAAGYKGFGVDNSNPGAIEAQEKQQVTVAKPEQAAGAWDRSSLIFGFIAGLFACVLIDVSINASRQWQQLSY